MLNYNTHIEKDSMFNTPPVFSIYVSMLTLKWLKNLGGISTIEKEIKIRQIYCIMKLIIILYLKGQQQRKTDQT